jgi:uroporphyrinogen-III synthase
VTGSRPVPRVVVTESEGPGATLASRLREAGVDVWMLPVVVHGPAPDPGPLDAALARMPAYDWVAFTSARAVEPVSRHHVWAGWPWTTAARPRIAAVGPVTASALRSRGLGVALCPDEPGARALANAMVAAEGGSISGRLVLWPRSDIARPELADTLQAAGACVVAPVVYCTRPNLPVNLAEVLAEIEAGHVDCVAFLSPSAAVNLAALAPGGTLALLARSTLVASVGPATSSALASLGAPAVLESPARTAGDLAAALLSYLGLSERSRS